MSNDPNESTTKYEITLDGVFKYLNKFESKIFVTYFGYHKPIVFFLKCNASSNKEIQ